MHSVQYIGGLTKILILEGILKNISYERHVYESVDEKILSEAMSRKTKKTSCINGLVPSKVCNMHIPDPKGDGSSTT